MYLSTTRPAGGTGDESGNSVVVDSGGYIHVTGNTNSYARVMFAGGNYGGEDFSVQLGPGQSWRLVVEAFAWRPFSGPAGVAEITVTCDFDRPVEIG